jgi:SAM-dependent methyltransferase
MPEYNSAPHRVISHDGIDISSFLGTHEENIDVKTVDSFGSEWGKFNAFNQNDLTIIGRDYFDLIDLRSIKEWVVLDVGCGSGRWAYFLSSYVAYIEAIDPSMAVTVAAAMLKNTTNVRVSHAGVDNLPFADQQFDMVYSLGVLHHVPDTENAILKCADKLKTGGVLLLYLYYNFETRGVLFKFIFKLSDLLRKIISRLPGSIKRFCCDLIAIFVYWPIVQFCKLVSLVSDTQANRLPLAYYRRTSFHIMRNDSLDRFGTPLEKRFSKKQIEAMLSRNGFVNIVFSNTEPFWHVTAKKS